jgi:hypothetical protein
MVPSIREDIIFGAKGLSNKLAVREVGEGLELIGGLVKNTFEAVQGQGLALEYYGV